MINKPKYHRRVFSGKSVPIIGLDQGKGDLYRGDGVRFMINGWYDASIEIREGHVLDSTYGDGIVTAGRLSGNSFLCEGSNIWAMAI